MNLAMDYTALNHDLTVLEFVEMDHPVLNPSLVNLECDWTRICGNGLPSFKPRFERELGEFKM